MPTNNDGIMVILSSPSGAGKTTLVKLLSKNNKVKQKKALTKSRKLYKKGIYYERPKIKSFKSKKSPHVLKAQKIYNIKSLKPNKELEKKTKCSLTGLKKIVNR